METLIVYVHIHVAGKLSLDLLFSLLLYIVYDKLYTVILEAVSVIIFNIFPKVFKNFT